jgi:hypothetical protein
MWRGWAKRKSGKIIRISRGNGEKLISDAQINPLPRRMGAVCEIYWKEGVMQDVFAVESMVQ